MLKTKPLLRWYDRYDGCKHLLILIFLTHKWINKMQLFANILKNGSIKCNIELFVFSNFWQNLLLMYCNFNSDMLCQQENIKSVLLFFKGSCFGSLPKVFSKVLVVIFSSILNIVVPVVTQKHRCINVVLASPLMIRV